MGNVKFHHSKVMLSAITSGLSAKFLPPYSPMLVEEAFSSLEAKFSADPEAPCGISLKTFFMCHVP